jgi:hypothetical protein
MKTVLALLVCLVMPFTSVSAKEKEDAGKQYIVVAQVQEQPGATHTGCQVLAADAVYAAIYSKVFGPASQKECEQWMKKNCKEQGGKKPETR